MRTLLVAAMASIVTLGFSQQERPDDSAGQSHRLQDLTWVEAEALLTRETVVVIPLGAASRPHGPHLPLGSDALLTGYLTDRVAAATPVLVAPAVTYHHDAALLEYAGSTSLPASLVRNLAAEIARSVARHGPRRFYVIASAPSAGPPLAEAAGLLRNDGILLRHADVARHLDPFVTTIQQQRAGDHAGEIETSMMLYVEEDQVDMSRAVKDDGPPSIPFLLTRQPGRAGIYSPSGVWGDATLASREKGRILVEALVNGILGDVAALRADALPAGGGPAVDPASREVPAARGPRGGPGSDPDSCSAGDERTIRQIGDRYSVAWRNHDPLTLAGLWALLGDMVHPDASVERTREVIRINRAELFKRPEFKASRHTLRVGHVRCLSDDIAVADGKWDLRDVSDATGRILPPSRGLLTLVVKRRGTWVIESFRYTVDPPEPQGPTLLKRPGYPGRGGG